MNTFFAILKDSFREAVDGFVIYVMLGLSALTVILVASLSFTPSTPDEAFPKIADKFGVAYQKRGESREPVGIMIRRGPINQPLPLPLGFAVSDVQRTDAGTAAAGSYKFKLTVKPKEQTPARPGKPAVKDTTDWLRFVTAAWANKDLKEMTVEFDSMTGMPRMPGFGDKPKKGDADKKDGDGGADDEAPGRGMNVTIPVVQPDEMKAVTDDMMTDLIKNQFAIHGAIDKVSVRRLTSEKEPEYAFEVEATTGQTIRGWPHTTKFLFGALTVSRNASLGEVLFIVQDQIVNGIGAAVTLLISVIMTAFFIPNMARKGSLDLLIAKPASRFALLLYKYIGGLTFIFLVSAVTIGGVWVALGVRSGHWNPEFLLLVPILTFTFAILYAVSTLMGVLTRNAIVAILVTCLFAAFLYVVGFAKSTLDLLRTDAKIKEDIPAWVGWTVDGLNNCLPRYKDLDKLTTKLLSESTLTMGGVRAGAIDRIEYPSWGATLGVSAAFITLMLMLSYWRFVTRDG